MKKIGIFLCVIGILSMLIGITIGLYLYFFSATATVIAIPFELSKTPTTQLSRQFSVPKNKYLSIWLSVPNRGIENSGLEIKISFVDTNNQLSAELVKKFGLMHTRRGTSKGQQYKLGKLQIAFGFKGQLIIKSKGFQPDYNASIELEQRDKTLLEVTLPYIISFIFGTLMLSAGIRVLVKVKK